jgi:ElaB/YqjD/DUF883 family membrane-anchored ribosome-binding protein
MMPTTSSSAASTVNRLADQAAQRADDTIKSTQRVANEALDRLSDQVQQVHDDNAPRLVRMAEQAESLARRGVDALRDRSHQLRARASGASDHTLAYIREEPVKSVLIAAAAGAAMAALASYMSRTRH